MRLEKPGDPLRPVANAQGMVHFESAAGTVSMLVPLPSGIALLIFDSFFSKHDHGTAALPMSGLEIYLTSAVVFKTLQFGGFYAFTSVKNPSLWYLLRNVYSDVHRENVVQTIVKNVSAPSPTTLKIIQEGTERLFIARCILQQSPSQVSHMTGFPSPV